MKDTEINDGGPAFPSPDWNGSWAGPEANHGISTRDWFAGQASIGPDEPHADLAAGLMGSDVPNWQADPVAASKWWAEAEAKLRFIKADAMLAARSTTCTPD